jgi:hypothetical protein
MNGASYRLKQSKGRRTAVNIEAESAVSPGAIDPETGEVLKP